MVSGKKNCKKNVRKIWEKTHAFYEITRSQAEFEKKHMHFEIARSQAEFVQKLRKMWGKFEKKHLHFKIV